MGKGKSIDGSQSFYRTNSQIVKAPKSGIKPQYGGNRPPAMRRAQVRGRG